MHLLDIVWKIYNKYEEMWNIIHVTLNYFLKQGVTIKILFVKKVKGIRVYKFDRVEAYTSVEVHEL